MRRLPPHKIEQNLSGLLNLLPEETEEILQRVDQPLVEAVDEKGRKYLQCDYNRDGDSHRSPWTNTYNPPLEDALTPSPKLRDLEIEMNELFDAYRELYYEGGTSSVYLWDLDAGFAGCFVIKKSVTNDRFVNEGSWDSINVIEAREEGGSSAVYKLTTTVMLHMDVDSSEVGKTKWAGSLTRQTEITSPVNEVKTHSANIGRMIEDMETDMRSSLNELYILKTRQIVNSIRSLNDGPQNNARHVANLSKAVLSHGMARKVDSEA